MTTRPDPLPGDNQVGLLLVRAPAPEVTQWLRRGVVPATVAPLQGWTAVVPDGPSRAQPPYGDGVMLLASRRVPRKLGPALGFWVIDGRGVLTVQTRGGGKPRWVVWQPEVGLVSAPGLPSVGPLTLMRLAGGGDRAELVELFGELYVQPDRLLAAVVASLDLPGARLVVDQESVADLPGAVPVEPAVRQVAWFDDAVKDAVALRKELEA